jgi:hypothetical protein
MAIDKLSFGLGAGYDFAVDDVDVNRIKLRSKETAPLTHNTLDENFANLAIKLNALIDTRVGDLTISEGGLISSTNLEINNGTGISYESGVFSHQAKPLPASGFTATSGNITDKIITGINVDSMGHFVGFESDTGAISPTFNSVSANAYEFHQNTTSSATECIHRPTTGEFAIRANSSERMRIDQNGNVGIGTTVPTTGFKLDVVGDSFRVSNAAKDDGVELGWSADAGVGFVQAYDRNVSAFRDLLLNNSVTIDSTGNVGIGIADQLYSGLTIADALDNNNAPYINLRNNNSDSHNRLGTISYWSNTLMLGTRNEITGNPNNTLASFSNNQIAFSTGPSHTDTSMSMIIDKDGNVGIGTSTDPKHLLQVEGGNIQCDRQIRATGWYTGDIANGGTATEIGVSTGTGYLMCFDRTTSEYKELRIQSGNNVLRLSPDKNFIDVSSDAGTNFQNLQQDSRSVAANDWIVGYGSTDHRRLTYDSAKKECVLTSGTGSATLSLSTDDTVGCYYKAKRIEPTVSKYRITIRARSSVATDTGFYIGVVYADSDTISDSEGLNTHVVTTSGYEENEEPPQDTFDGLSPDTLEVSWVRQNGGIEDSWVTYTYEITPPAGEKWFSVILLNWEGMGNADLFFDPLIDVEPINPTFEYDSATGILNIVNP